MKIINEEIENLETIETTTVVNQPTGAAKAESKTLWDRFMEATKEPEDAPLFGAEGQPVPEKPVEPKMELEESLFEEGHIITEGYYAEYENDVKYSDSAKQELADFINDRINRTLEGVFEEAYSEIDDLPDPEMYENPRVNKLIARLVRELVAEYFGPTVDENLDERLSKWNYEKGQIFVDDFGNEYEFITRTKDIDDEYYYLFKPLSAEAEQQAKKFADDWHNNWKDSNSDEYAEWENGKGLWLSVAGKALTLKESKTENFM